jgi:hypothetical protein
MAVTIDGSAGVTTNAGGSVNPSTNVEGINYSCRAWVNFNGTGTVAIRASGNVTSITDGGVGTYTVNLTTAMSDVNAAPVASGQRYASTVSRAGTVFANMSSTTAVRVFTGFEDTFSGAIPVDLEFVQIAVFR